MQEIAVSKHLHIHSVKDGEEVMITNDNADHIFKRLMIDKKDVPTIRILLSQVEDETDEQN